MTIARGSGKHLADRESSGSKTKSRMGPTVLVRPFRGFKKPCPLGLHIPILPDPFGRIFPYVARSIGLFILDCLILQAVRP